MSKQPIETFQQALEADFSALREKRGDIALFSTREHAMDRLRKTGLPTQRLEAWKHTNMDPLYRRHLHWFTKSTKVSDKRLREWVERYAPEGFEQKTIILVDGRVAGMFIDDMEPEKVTIRSAGKVVEKGLDAPRTTLIEEVAVENEASRALSAAGSVFWRDGLYVDVANTESACELHVLHVVTQETSGAHLHPQFLYDVQRSADLTIFEQTVGIGSSNAWLNIGRHIHLKENASFEHIVLQQSDTETITTTNTYVSQGQDSNYRLMQCDIGGRLVRNNITDRLREEHAEGGFFGVYIAEGDQLIDNYTLFDHVAKHCLSRELYKGVLDGSAHAVFNGRVIVRKQAQKTDAYQKNNNLLLSDNAQVNTKPQLEIYADDVQCTHGATIGQIEDDAVFYMQSRGINREEAKRLLRTAFIGEVLGEIKHDVFQTAVQKVVESRLA